MAALTEATEALYSAFATNRLGARIDYCAHCGLEREEEVLRSTPLRELTQEQLTPYAFRAMTTFGGVTDFRHFFPRIAELVTQHGFVGALDFGVLIRKLDYGDWKTWPATERDAIERWLESFERAFFMGPEEPNATSEDLLAAAKMRGAREGFVERWLAATTAVAAEALGQAVVDLAGAHQRSRAREPSDGPDLMPHLDRVRHALIRHRCSSGVRYALEVLSFPPFV